VKCVAFFNLRLVVSPTAFSFNKEAAEDNYFMDSSGRVGESDIRSAVLREYAGLHDRLTNGVTGVGATCHLFTHEEHMGTPDGSLTRCPSFCPVPPDVIEIV
jgi:hypothetical protein